MAEDYGEGGRLPPLPGEDRAFPAAAPSAPEVIKDKKLTFEEASRCLNTLGKDESGSRYAYLKISATDLKLTDVSIILNFKHLLYLDVGGNYLNLEALQALTQIPFLLYLKADRNRVESAALKPMFYLQVLILSQNQIKGTCDIDQPLLDTLELSFNDIYTTNFEDANLKELKQLELRSNLIFEIGGVYPPKLEKLYMAANKITSINSKEFASLANLEILHLRENQLQNLDGFSENLKNLKYINLRNNKISKFGEFRKLQCLPKLETLVVTGNPLPGTETPPVGGEGGFVGEGGKIRDPVVIPLLILLPKLKRINKNVITIEERIDAEDLEGKFLESLLKEEGEVETDLETETTNLDSDYKSEVGEI